MRPADFVFRYIKFEAKNSTPSMSQTYTPGKLLISFVNTITMIAPYIADWK